MLEYDLEADLSVEVGKFLRNRSDVLLTRVEAGGEHRKRLTTVGTADWCGLVVGGRHIEIELKRRDGKSRPAQKARATQVERLGGVYAVCRTVRDVEAAIFRAKEGI